MLLLSSCISSMTMVSSLSSSLSMVVHIPSHHLLRRRRRSRTNHLSARTTTSTTTTSAKLQLSEILGGRGLCGGEKGIELELKKPSAPVPPLEPAEVSSTTSPSSTIDAEDTSFEKELLGLTGGFPGGEKGLNKFIQENPPPKGPKQQQQQNKKKKTTTTTTTIQSNKPLPPELPLFMPGMIVIVKNPANPFHMYTGIVQRVTDGKAGVLFEGGNWDKLITFRLDELDRRDKGPPMVNPKSAVLQS